jgi:hypothetical protein
MASGWLRFTPRGRKEAGQYEIVRPSRFDDEGLSSLGSKSEPLEGSVGCPSDVPKVEPRTKPIYTRDIQGPEGATENSPTAHENLNARKQLRKVLSKLVIPVYDDATLDEWAGLAQEIGKCRGVEECLTGIKWIVRTAREEGRSTERARLLFDIAERWAKLRHAPLDDQPFPAQGSDKSSPDPC